MDNQSTIKVPEEFLLESLGLLDKCEEALSAFTTNGEASEFVQYGQSIDRLMAGALGLNLKLVGELAKHGKELSQKACQLKDMEKLLAVSSLLSQFLRVVRQELKMLKKGKTEGDEVLEPLLKKLKAANEALKP